MRRGLLALCLIASMVIAGCLGPSSADWGTGAGAVNVDFSMEETTVESTLSGSKQTFDGLEPVGCTPGSDGGVLSASEGEAVAFSGYLGASQFYESHDSALGVQGLEHGVTTAVAIQSMSFDQAASVAGGDGPRIDVSEWSNPLSPETGTGTVDLDEFPDDDEPSGWFVLGLIPTTENVLSGLKSLNEWHQPVVVHGYLVSSSDASSSPYGYQASWHKADNDCNMVVKGGERSDALVFVSKITLDGATVSSNGNADDEWVYGDVPFLGRGVFVLFFLVGGVGGSVGLFILSKQMMMRSAKQSMRTLIGDEGMKKAASVKSDAKAAKKAGMESPDQRQKRVDKERRQAEKKQERTVPEKAPKKTEDALGGFDLDSVLASTSTPSGGSSGPSGRKSSVVVTEAAKEMSRTSTNTSPASAPSSSRVAQQRGPPRTKQPPAGEEERKPTVRRRRAVKKTSPPKEESAAPKYDEEEEFSDFSF